VAGRRSGDTGDVVGTYLHKGLELGPLAVQRIVDAIPSSEYDRQVDPERFSLRDSVAHLADWDTINLERVRRGATEPGCTVPGLDEGQRALDSGYANTDPREQARLFVQRRAELLRFVDGLTEEDLAKVYYHSERGRQTVYESLVTILGHDTYHVEHLARYLAPRS